MKTLLKAEEHEERDQAPREAPPMPLGRRILFDALRDAATLDHDERDAEPEPKHDGPE